MVAKEELNIVFQKEIKKQGWQTYRVTWLRKECTFDIMMGRDRIEGVDVPKVLLIPEVFYETILLFCVMRTHCICA